MNHKFVYPILLTINFILLGCSESNSVPQQSAATDSIEVYKDYPATSSEKFKMGDTIPAFISTSFNLYFKTSYDSLYVPAVQNNMELVRSEHNLYRITPTSVGKDLIYALPDHATVDANSKDYICIKIKGYNLSYLISSDTCVIEAPSNVTKNKISNEIHDSFLPSKLGQLQFKYVTKTSGDFIYRKLPSYKTDSITGTFTTDKDVIYNSPNDFSITYQLSYQGKTQTILLKKTEGQFCLVQDFTEYFQTEYPSEGITTAILYSTATENSATWSMP